MWYLDSKKMSFQAEWASNFGLLTCSLIFAAPVIMFKIKDTTDEDNVQNGGTEGGEKGGGPANEDENPNVDGEANV